MSQSKFEFHKKLEQRVKSGEIPEKFRPHLEQMFENHVQAFMKMGQDLTPILPILDQYLEIVWQQCLSPYPFSPYHKQLCEPIDYYKFGIEFSRPLLDLDASEILHSARFNEVEEHLKKGENVVLFGNHQAEPDPQAISLLLEKEHPKLAREMIFVAGHKVTQDPLAIPFSLGRNLLCIFSKKHIESPPEKKGEKQLHNLKTMEAMRQLLSEGGKCIYVAPSGGRDRLNDEGVVEISPFDPQSIEMFRMMAAKAKHPTHFYPLALDTYDWFPPPQKVEDEVGELRPAFRTGVKMAIGKEVDMERFPGFDCGNKKEARVHLAKHIWQQVVDLYTSF